MLHLSIHVYNERGVEVFNALLRRTIGMANHCHTDLYRVTFWMPGNILNVEAIRLKSM